MILSVLCYPRWPSQVQSLSHFADIFARETLPMYKSFSMGMVYTVNSSVGTSNLQLILLSKILMFVNLVKPTLHFSKTLRILNLSLFFSSFSAGGVIGKPNQT
jgi:hypothetical protein